MTSAALELLSYWYNNGVQPIKKTARYMGTTDVSYIHRLLPQLKKQGYLLDNGELDLGRSADILKKNNLLRDGG